MTKDAEPSKQRPPVSLEDLRNCGWQSAIAASGGTYDGFARELRAEARRAVEAGDGARANALDLLVSICSLGMDPSNRREPFEAFIVLQGRRSFLPEDLEPNELAAIADFGLAVSLPLLRCRLVDIAWLNVRPKKVEYARAAIDSYCFDSAGTEAWFQGGRERWARAIVLCLEIRKGDEGRLQAIEESLLKAVLEEPNTASVRCSVAELLRSNRLGTARCNEIAERLDEEARILLARPDPFTARELLLEAARWYQNSERPGDAARVTVLAGGTWVAEAQLNEANATNGYVVAGTHYDAAIRLLRTIPRKERAPLGVDEKIQAWRQKLTECIERGTESMSLFESKEVDISEMVATSKKSVAGKPFAEALVAFCRLVRPISAETWRKHAAEAARRYPLQTLFSTQHVSSDGRIVARSPGLTLGDETSSEWKTAIHQGAVQNAARHISLLVTGGILPALEVLAAEHRFLVHDFVELAARSPIVPEGREQMVGRGLCAGFRQDFGVAVHLLTPQLEHIVRCALRSVGAQTRHLDEHGIEMEVGLSALMEMPEADKVLGSFAFELRTLFCEAVGYNLRNDLAHGLIDDSHMSTAATVYGWWFCLRLIMLPFLRAGRAAIQSQESSVPLETGGPAS